MKEILKYVLLINSNEKAFVEDEATKQHLTKVYKKLKVKLRSQYDEQEKGFWVYK